VEKLRYSVIFEGMSVPGIPEKTAKANLALALHCDPSHAEIMFDGRETTLRSGLEEAPAREYVETLHKAGIVARMEHETNSLRTAATDVSGLSLMEEPAPDKPAAGQDNAPPAADSAMEFMPTDWVVQEKPNRDGLRQGARARRTAGSAHEEDNCELSIVSVHGRLGRLRFMAWNMALVLVELPFIVIFLAMLEKEGGLPTLWQPFLMIAVASCIVYVCFIIRRLHDINLSGWWALLVFIGNAGAGYQIKLAMSADSALILSSGVPLLTLALLCAIPGSAGTNNYDSPPPPNNVWIYALSALFALSVIANAVTLAA
jgi:uncharacterized membrane protein YhaH (DUF805 family)